MREVEQAPRVVRLEPGRRLRITSRIEIVHARLVEDDMRKLGQPVFDILDPAAADDPLAALSSGFQNVVSLTQ